MRRLVLLAGVLVTMLPASATAADFTLRVPVTLTNVPSVNSLRVECVVSRVEVTGVGVSAASNIIGSASTDRTVSGGSFAEEVIVEVTARGIISPDQARSYSCGLTVFGTARTGVPFRADSGNMQSMYETATGTTLASYRSFIRTNLPR